MPTASSEYRSHRGACGPATRVPTEMDSRGDPRPVLRSSTLGKEKGARFHRTGPLPGTTWVSDAAAPARLDGARQGCAEATEDEKGAEADVRHDPTRTGARCRRLTKRSRSPRQRR